MKKQIWLVLLLVVAAQFVWAGPWQTVLEWQQALEFEGSRHIITGRLLRDAATGEEQRQYLDANGVVLPDFLFQTSRRSWSPQTVREAYAAVASATPSKKAATPKAIRILSSLREQPVAVRLGALDLQMIELEDENIERAGIKTKRIGVFRDLPKTVGPSISGTGRWQALPDGGSFWSIRVVSPEAIAIRAHLRLKQLPAGCAIVAFDSNDRSVFVGPYSANDFSEEGDLWTESVFASDITLGCHVPAGVDRRRVAFEVDKIIHTYIDPARLALRKEGWCHNDVTCFSEWMEQARAVVGIGTVGFLGQIYCTGCMLNDTRGHAAVPYMLTASHCVKDQRQADSTEYYWFYETSTCNGTPPNPRNVTRTGGGADWLAGMNDITGNDFAFMRLRHAPPGGVLYAGWSTRAIASGESLATIHHPDGTHKRIAFGGPTTPKEKYWHVRWSSGATEPGSSGAPLFNAKHQVVGQLWGGYSSCDNQQGIDEYGRFDITYPIVEQWLDPVYHGSWYISASSVGPYETSFGFNGVIPVPADYDGDGKADLAVFNPPNGKWHFFGSRQGYWETQFGFSGVIPVPADYDGDGKADIGVYYAPEGKWHIFSTREGYKPVVFGYPGTVPVVADYDGDGKADIGVYHAPEGKWHIFGSASGYAETQFGFSGTRPVPADYDGDGKADIGVYHPPTGMWRMFCSLTGYREAQFGFDGAVPVPADYDGDKKADIGVYYAPTAEWQIFRSSRGYLKINYGFPGTVPVVADYDGDGKADIALYY